MTLEPYNYPLMHALLNMLLAVFACNTLYFRLADYFHLNKDLKTFSCYTGSTMEYRIYPAIRWIFVPLE